MRLKLVLPRVAGLIALLAALVGQPVVVNASTTWNVVSSPNAGSRYNDLVGVAASSNADVWAVGNFANQSGPYRTLAEHWDGSAWKVVSTPNVGTNYNFLNGVAAIAPTNVWAVGQSYLGHYQTLAEHWDGTSWKVVASPGSGSGDNLLNAVAAVTATNVWAVGENGSNQTLIEHWNGTAWSVVPSPSVAGQRNSLAAIAVVSANDIWAVGQFGQEASTLTEHWNGSAWSIVRSPNPGSGDNGLFLVAAISSSDVWAVGSKAEGTQTLAEHWNGTSWSAVATPNPVGPGVGNSFLAGVTALSTNDVWSVGTSLNFVEGSLEQTMSEQWNGTSWSVVSTPNRGTSNNSLNKVAATSNGTVWAVGHFNPSPGAPQRTLIVETNPG